MQEDIIELQFWNIFNKIPEQIYQLASYISVLDLTSVII